MDRRMTFERNLLCLAGPSAELCKRLSSAETTRERYRMLPARNGREVPAIVDAAGSARPLHSLVDPEREAVRLVSTINGDSYLILFGLGGGFVAEAALHREDVHGLLIVEHGLDGVAELLATNDYVRVFGDSRCTFLVDPTEAELEQEILRSYRPALCGGIAVLPLRPRVEADGEYFDSISGAVKGAIDAISDDYSVQAYFGKRWFANAIRNLLIAERPISPITPARSVAVTAAGPSLDDQLPLLKERRKQRFILATDTSLPALLDADLKPDAVISIDCQHISYYHFMEGLPEDVPLYLDLASPPVVASRTRSPHFFSGGHPFTVYVSRAWRSIPRIDTSGGNVTYAAVALANAFGAETIELYGADFSYPRGAAYARGTYIHPTFRRLQTRLRPLESQFASFVFRNESLRILREGETWRYETKPLVSYRTRLERLAQGMESRLEPVYGGGAPIAVPPERNRRAPELKLLGSGAASCGARTFLSAYRGAIEALPALQGPLPSYLAALSDEERDVLTTLLPAAAAIRRRSGEGSPALLLESVRSYCVDELRRLDEASRR